MLSHYTLRATTINRVALFLFGHRQTVVTISALLCFDICLEWMKLERRGSRHKRPSIRLWLSIQLFDFPSSLKSSRNLSAMRGMARVYIPFALCRDELAAAGGQEALDSPLPRSNMHQFPASGKMIDTVFEAYFITKDRVHSYLGA